jgi:antitoxin component of MazEF toxin-antitoxin module
LVVVPVKAPTYQLADLVAAITRQNVHGEVTTNGAQGRETW